MDNELVVVRAFGPYAVGDRITDAKIAATLLGSENATCVVQARPAKKEG